MVPAAGPVQGRRCPAAFRWSGKALNKNKIHALQSDWPRSPPNALRSLLACIGRESSCNPTPTHVLLRRFTRKQIRVLTIFEIGFADRAIPGRTEDN